MHIDKYKIKIDIFVNVYIIYIYIVSHCLMLPIWSTKLIKQRKMSELTAQHPDKR